MFAAARAWVAQYAAILLAAVAAAGWALAGVQTLRIARQDASIARVEAAAATGALTRYAETSARLDQAATDLLKAKGVHDAALKKTGREVIKYVVRPGADVQCLDDDGLRIVADLGRAKATDTGDAAGAVPGRVAAAD